LTCESSCSAGRTGVYCTEKCTCSNGGSCTYITNATSAKCNCDRGWMGNSCDEACPRGTYGFQCKEKCIETVGTEKATVKNEKNIEAITQTYSAGSKGECNPITGQPVCLPGFSGYFCVQPCEKGKYGHNCSLNCTCTNGECNLATG
jgi:hypothetical protein